MNVGLLLIHALVGAFVFAHGAQHLLGWFGGGGVSGTATYMEAVGLRHGRLMAAAAGTNELVGGTLLALGLATPLAAAMIGATMLVAARTDHRGKGFWIYNGGAEYVLTNAAVVVGLAFAGAGRFSLDAAIGWDVGGVAWGIGAAGAAVAGVVAVLALFRARDEQVQVPQPA